MTRTLKTNRRALVARVETMEARIALTTPGGVVYNPNAHISNGPTAITLINTNNSGAGLSKTLISINTNTGGGSHTITLINTNNSGAGLSKGFSVTYKP